MSSYRKIHMGLGLGLVTAFALLVGSAWADSPDALVGDEAVGKATRVVLDPNIYPPGTKISCTMSGPTFTGRRWAYLVIGFDNSTCYRFADPNNPMAAPMDVVHCKGLGYKIGCDNIIDQ